MEMATPRGDADNSLEAARAAVGVAVFAEGAAANFSLAAWRLGSMYPAA